MNWWSPTVSGIVWIIRRKYFTVFDLLTLIKWNNSYNNRPGNYLNYSIDSASKST